MGRRRCPRSRAGRETRDAAGTASLCAPPRLIFKILPDSPVEWVEVWLGAAIAALLFTLGKHLISLYIGSSNMASSYGPAGALIIVLVWVYYSVQILLLGAEFAKAYSDRRRALRQARQTARAVA